MTCLFILILVILIFLKMVKIFILSNTYSHFNTLKIINYNKLSFSYNKKLFHIFFNFTKYYFNFKSNNFKCSRLKAHFHSNKFKMVNLFSIFQIEISKITTININKHAHILSSTIKLRKF